MNWNHVLKGIALDLAVARDWPGSIVERFLRERHAEGASLTTLLDLAAELADRPDLRFPNIILTHVPSPRSPETPRLNRKEPKRCTVCGWVLTTDGECGPDCNGEHQ